MSVVTTVLNESTSIVMMLESIVRGTLAPDEIVVTDGGSTDGTGELLDRFASSHPSVKVIHLAGGRSAGRNAAIKAAGHQRIALIDGGCIPTADWLEKLIKPFDRGATWVGGFYKPSSGSRLTRAIGLTMVYVREEAEQHFLPSARSMAFHRQLWEEVGGFPEGIQFAEDTAFVDRLLLAGHRFVFAPDAVVDWTPPASLGRQARTLYAWGRGDGLMGLRAEHYKRVARAGAASLSILVGLAILEPKLVPFGFVPLMFLVRDVSRLKYRHMSGWTRWILIPMATVNGLASSLLGFLAGRATRRRGSG